MAMRRECHICGYDKKSGTVYECRKCEETGHIASGTFSSDSCLSKSCPKGGNHDLRKLYTFVHKK